MAIVSAWCAILDIVQTMQQNAARKGTRPAFARSRNYNFGHAPYPPTILRPPRYRESVKQLCPLSVYSVLYYMYI